VWGGPIDLSGDASVSGGNHLTLAGPISGSGPGGLTVGGVVGVAGSKSNSYAGPTTVTAGTLLLNKTSGVDAIPGSLQVGVAPDGPVDSDTVFAAEVRLGADKQIADSSSVTVTSVAGQFSGKFDFNGKLERIGALVVNGGTVESEAGGLLSVESLGMTGGSIDTGPGTLVLNGDLTTNAAAASATIAGKLDLGSGTHTFTVANGAAPEDLIVSAAIGGSGGLTKGGTGTQTLSGANTYSGATLINTGVLNVQNSLALGATSAGTTVAAG